MNNDETNNEAAGVDSTGGPSEAGDMEAAGETTAASAIKGPDDSSPVGAETMVKVAGDSRKTENGSEESE